MEPIAWIFIIVVALGAIVAGIFGLGVLILCWWWMIPLIGALAGGWIGFFFAVGLVVIIAGIKAAFSK